MIYADMLQHPNWQKKRLRILDRDNFTCTLCGDTDTQLHVHHKSYSSGKKPWEYPESNLTTLCKDCHLLETKVGGGSLVIKTVRKSKNTNNKEVYLMCLSFSQEKSYYGILLFKIDSEGSVDTDFVISEYGFPYLLELINIQKELNGK